MSKVQTVSQARFLEILTYAGDWPPVVVAYGGKTWVHTRAVLEDGEPTIYRAKVQG